MAPQKRSMPETWYRASRLCRLLGNPMAYLVVKGLGEEERTPSQLAEELGVPLSTISRTLSALRNLDVVRYVTRGREKVYWMKDRRFLQVLASLEGWVERLRAQGK